MKPASLFFLLFAVPTIAGANSLVLVSTTTTQNSGLMEVLLPEFEADTGIRVNLISAGTGEAIEIARRGDADVILVHHRPSEDGLIAEGSAIGRRDVMHNDFVLVGPHSDPANIAKASSPEDAMRRIFDTRHPFAGRGDQSGTHRRELDLWQNARLVPEGGWYRQTGAGMGATLNIASAMNAYALSDRATWIAFGNKGDLALLYSGSTGLLNPYGIMLVNPARHPHVRAAAGQRLIDWMVSIRGQTVIARFRVGGLQMFCPDALPETLIDDAASRALCAAK